ncbi:hypothetical protein ACNHKD_06730 [Methylocystis sp. JAN1]|uniref:hypothetical protein n=1 Tax=Methylocystis sp. JAN1 TaxID=3397211 RepID=UPI003FA2D75E
MLDAAIGAPRIHISEFSVHLPLAIDRAVSEIRSAISQDGAPIARHTALPAPIRGEALKILAFDIEPAAMGPICVRMKITHSRIEIRMDAQLAAAPVLLEAREKLSSAIGDKGLSLDAYEVRVSPPASPSVATPDAPAESASDFDRSFSNDEGSNRQGRQNAGKRAPPPRDDPPSFVPVGLVL